MNFFISLPNMTTLNKYPFSVLLHVCLVSLLSVGGLAWLIRAAMAQALTQTILASC